MSTARTLYTLALIALLAACGAPDAAQTNEATPAAAYPYPLPTALEASPTLVAPAPPEPSATPFYTPIPSNTPDVPRSPTPTADPLTLLDTGRPISQIERLAFADAEHGWLYGYACAPEGGACTPEIDASDDGGRSWRRLPTPLIRRRDSTSLLSFNISGFFLTSQSDGWLLTTVAVQQGDDYVEHYLLAATHDGGNTWHEDEHSGGVTALSYAAGTLWMIEPPTERSKPEVLLHSSSDNGHSWRTIAAAIPTELARVRFNRLVRAGAHDAWLTSLPGPVGVAATSDGGQRWSFLANPCSEYSWFTAFDQQHLWVMCKGQPSVGLQSKELYQSLDGGAVWAKVAKTEDPGSGAGCDGECTLWLGYGGSMQCVSSSKCFVSYEFGITVTNDGGRTWNSAIADMAANTYDWYTRDMLFLDTQHGWVATTKNVYRTADGGTTWERVAVP